MSELAARRSRVWRAVVLASAAAAGLLYLTIGWRAEGNQRPDAAYYLGVARHIATTGSFEEPIVWHYLNPPDSVKHAPFDYWAPLGSLTLVPSLWAFGVSDRVAFVTMALISALSVVLFAHFVTTSHAIRHGPIQFLALLLFAFSPALASYRFDTESIPVFHLVLVLALLALNRQLYAAAVVAGAALLWCRGGAGSVFCLLIWGAVVFGAVRQDVGSRRTTLRSAGIAAAVCAGIYIVFNLLSFGTLFPPAARLGPFLSEPLDLLRWGVDPEASLPALLSRLAPANLLQVTRTTADALVGSRLVPYPMAWLALAVLPLFGVARRRLDAAGLSALLVFAGTFLTVLGANAVYSDRTPLVLLPVLVFAGACGLDRAFSWLHEKLASRASRSVVSAATAIVIVALGTSYALQIRPYGDRGPAWRGTPGLERLAGTLDGQAVATELPYFVLAETGNPAITLPLDGEAAVEAVLQRYDARWLLLFGTDFATPDLPTEVLVREVLGGTRSRIGSFRLRHVRTQPGEWVLLRLDPA